MKGFLIDLCLIGLFLFAANALLNNNNIEKTMFEREITQFEDDVQNQKTISSDYGTASDNSENTLSLVVKSISDFCVYVIQTLILLISNFISMLL